MSNTQTENVSTQELYHEKFNIPRIPLAEALWQLDLSIKQNQTRGVWCFISEAGVGKSQGVREVARKHGLRVVDIRTAQYSLMGAGVPQRADETTGHFKIAVPDDFPKKGEKALILFEEVNQGQAHAVSMFFQFLEDRGLFNYLLPDDCIVVALMNPATAGYNVTRLETNHAFNRRLMKAYVYSTFKEWMEHAKRTDFHYSDGLEKPCHPWVLRFLDADPNRLYTEAERDKNQQFACPATWQTVSLSLYNLEAAGEPLTSARAKTRIAASINSTNAESLTRFIADESVLVAPDKVLADYATDEKLRHRLQRMARSGSGEIDALIENLTTRIIDNEPEVTTVVPNFVKFWRDLPLERLNSVMAHFDRALKKNDSELAKKFNYMTKLTQAMGDQEEFESIIQEINAAEESMRGLDATAKDGKSVSESPQ